MKRLQEIGASILWFIALFVVLAQGYRAVAYYVVDMPIDWTWHDIVLAMIAFMLMFVPAKLKTIVVSTMTRIAGKK